MKKLLIMLFSTIITVILVLEFNSTNASLDLEPKQALDLYNPVSGKIDVEYLREIIKESSPVYE